ncbi:hypothetical protein [Anaplasma phagocytophilum]|uniref:hypothetical protein n=1 Tax=Anaplasma phagocytophilum TaxID=948 RepID=UPI00201AACDA
MAMLLQTYGFTDIVVDVNDIFISSITCTKIKDLGSGDLVEKSSKPFWLSFDSFSKIIVDRLLLEVYTRIV